MRCVIARVLPVPAPASTHIGPSGWAATSRCSGSSAASTSSGDGATAPNGDKGWGRLGIVAILSDVGDAPVAR